MITTHLRVTCLVLEMALLKSNDASYVVNKLSDVKNHISMARLGATVTRDLTCTLGPLTSEPSIRQHIRVLSTSVTVLLYA